MEEHLHSDDRLPLHPTAADNVLGAGTHDGDTHRLPFTLRYLLGIGFRHQRLVILSFALVFAAVFVFVLLRPPQYESRMKILVKRERVDPLVSPEASSQQSVWLGISEEELNSEVELIKSRDLLAQVVVATGLDAPNTPGIAERVKGAIWRHAKQAAPERRIASAAESIGRRLQVQPLRKSAVIEVTYASEDPKLSADVLTSLADHYLDKHLAVHRPSGAFAFFEQETERYGKELALVQARLNDQNRKEAVISVQVQRENALRRLGELEATEQTTRAQIADIAARIRVLESQLGSTPARAAAGIRRGSPVLLEQLYSMRATYELKRIELQRIFQPEYPLVQEVETQISKLDAEIAGAEASPLVEETTDRNPTYDYLVTELAKNRSELAGLQARVSVTAKNLVSDRERAWQLEQVTLTQQALVRAATQAEQNQLIYSRKREEARISNALDAQRIVNVAIAEKATIPYEPSGPPRLLLLLLGGLFAALVSVGLACVADYLDPSFRTPDEVEAFLGLPVLASIPRREASAELIS